MTTKEVLIAAKALIDTPEKWCQGQDSINGAYCARGALDKVCPDPQQYLSARHALVDALPKCAHGWLTRYNDTRSHKTVMAWFDRAIEAAAKS